MYIEVREHYNVKNLTSFKVSSIIERAYFPKSVDELTYLLTTLKKPQVLGNCSNVLISSSGFEGDLIFTTKCNQVKIDGNKIYAECGAKGPMVAKQALEQNLSGFEFMIGFPGSIGGEICMNASAKEQCISDFLQSATVFDYENNKVIKLTKEELNFSYRNSVCQEKPYIVLFAEFELPTGDKNTINEKMNFNLEFRKKHQPSLKLPNCGSVFKNPENISAGKLLDEANAKTFSVNGAKVWENHANFIINYNNATSEDILNLMLLMYNTVKDNSGIKLVPEIKYIGNKSEIEAKIWKTLLQK